MGRCEPPLPYRSGCFVVETHAKTMDHANFADGAILAHDNLQDDVAFESGSASLFCIVRSDLS